MSEVKSNKEPIVLTSEQEAQQAQEKLKQLEEINMRDGGQEIQAILDKRGLILTPVLKFVGQSMDTGVIINTKPKQ